MSGSEPRVASCLVAAFSVFLLGFSLSSVNGIPVSRQSRSSGLSIKYLLGLSTGEGEEVLHDPPQPTEPPFMVKFRMPVQLSDALEKMVAHVREANRSVVKHETEALSFIGVMSSPGQLERTATELMRELRHVWKGLRRHKYTRNVKLASTEFKTWLELVSQTVRKLQRAPTAPALQWLHSIHFNYTLQSQAFERLISRAIKIAWKASLDREDDAQYIKAVADSIGVLSSECKGLGHVIEEQWLPSKMALISLSTPALNLVQTLSSNSRKAKTLAVELRSSTLKPMGRQFRSLEYTVNDPDLYRLFASNVMGEWKTAVIQSPHQGFLVNQTLAQQHELDMLMKRLKHYVLKLRDETSVLRPYILNLLGYEDNNTSRSPPVIKEVDELAKALRFFIAPPIISDGEDMVNQMLHTLRRRIKKIST